MDSKKIVVIGGVAAGPKAAARARRRDPNAKITILDRGDLFSYAGCGMPFYIEGLIEDINELMCTPIGVVRDASFFKKVKDIHVIGMTEATKIDRSNKKLVVKNLQSKEEHELDYDKLVITTGAYPIIPPIDGIELGNVHRLNKPTDAQAIKKTLDEGRKKIVIIGGGLIGLETCGAFVSRNCQVTIIEMLPQILPGLLDFEMAQLLANYLKDLGVNVRASEKVTKLEGDEDSNVKCVYTEKVKFDADMVIVAVGVRPDIKLAKDAGLKIGETGAIAVNESLQTSDPDIYAGGDCVECIDTLTGKKIYVPLGSTANKQGRVIGDNITGGNSTFPGILGTTAFKIVDYNVGKTGLSEKQAKELGYDAVTCLTPSPDCAHYYPESKSFVIKLIADKKNGKILGGQIIGFGEGIKRTDILASAIKFGASVKDLADIDLSYAPPYSTAIDAIAHAANVIRNKMDGLAKGISPIELKKKIESNDDFVLFDVRTKMEVERKSFKDPRVKNIPLNDLRSSSIDIHKDKELIVFCMASLRAYEAQLILESRGHSDVKFLDGGIIAWPYDL
jgi:NADPH-dependent 2,4-dienoyl-CoA reductase/sulfur reductase-like enzyme/rhodanese-related sulfurtransferase